MTIVFILLVILLVAAIPSWPHSKGWGYYPSGILGTILVLLVVLYFLGYL